MAVAHHADPDALAEAANMLGEDEIRLVRTHWRMNAQSLRHEAGAKLTSVIPEYEAERRDPVGRAVDRLGDALYLAVRIRATGDGLTIETRTRERPPRTIRTRYDEAADALERTGTGEFLNQHVAGGCRRVTEARIRPGTETTVVDWQRPPTLQIGDRAPPRPITR